MSDTDIANQALTIIKSEKTTWEDATSFVTEKVAFQMRNLIKQLRKNYWGIFDVPTDPITGRKKIWVPLTEVLCEAIIKNIDLDTKDINFRAKKAESVGLNSLVKNIVKNNLDETYFGEDLDDFERRLTIDGTAVWKTTDEWSEELKKKITTRSAVDLLNFYIDPIAKSIQDTPSVIERAVMTVDDFANMDKWFNKESVVGHADINRNDEYLPTFRTGTKLVEVFERWGKMPKYLITGNKEDKELIEGQIVASGTKGDWKIHYIAENKKGIKPYEEAWYTRVPGRWYGKGIAEKVMMLQLWINTIINLRVNRSFISQLGIFKVKKGSGISPQMVSRLPSNGAIMVNDMNDIENFVVQEAGATSYKDEETIQGWAEKLTSAFASVTGEDLPSTMPATNAVMSGRAAQSQFSLIKEGIGMFLQRWIKRHYLPTLMKHVKEKDIIRITGETEELRVFDERLINEELYKQIDEINKRGGFVMPEQVEFERQRTLERLSQSGRDRFTELIKNIDFTEFDVQVYITNEEIDKGVLTQNLLSALQLAPEYKDKILVQIFDIMGLDSNQLKSKTLQPPAMQGMPQGMQQPQGTPQPPSQSQQQSITNANIPQYA